MRAILDVLRLMRHRETNSDVEKVAWAFAAVLLQAGTQLTVLSPAGGEEELVTAVAVEVARLGACEGAMRDMEFGGGRRFAPAVGPTPRTPHLKPQAPNPSFPPASHPPSYNFAPR